MRKNIFIFLLCLVTCCFGFAQNNVIDNDLQKILNQKSGDYIDVNIMFKSQMSSDELSVLNCKSDTKEVRREIVTNELKKFAERSQKDVMSVLQAEERSNKVADIQSYWIANFINCKAKADVIYQLASHPDVATISYNNVMEVVSDSKETESRDTRAVTATIGEHLTQIKADKVWDLGYTGKGVVVAIIDSGVNTEHTDLKDHLWNGNAQHGYNIVNPGQNPIDDRSHGTHCAGIICGDGTSGTMTGVAPDAQLMCIKGYDSNTGFTIDRLITCVQWAVTNGAQIINISQGWLGASDANRRTLRTVFDNVLGSGVIAVVACGNDRDKIDNYPVPGNVRTPGDCPPPWLHPDQTTTGGLSSVVSVGGVDDSNNIVAVSSQGPAKWDDYPYKPGMGLIRPDIVAPATAYSLSNDASNNKYVTKGGTSQAAPCVAGVMALMLEKNPDLTPEDLCRIVERTATRRTATKDNLYGSGVVDALEAVRAVTFNVDEPVLNVYDFTRTFNAGSNLNLELTLINNGKASTNGNTTVTISENDTYTTIVNNSATYGTMGVMDLQANHSSVFIEDVTESATFVVSFDKLIPDNYEVTFTVNIGSKSFNIVVTVYNELVAPTLNATANGTDINLSWNATNNATSYNIYRDGVLLKNTKSTSYTDAGLEYGTIYAYNVTTKRNELESEHSLTVRVQTADNPAKPSPTKVVATNNGTNASVTWTNGAESKGSNIYRKDVTKSVETSIATNVNGTSYTDNTWNSLADGVYQYGVANTYAANENIYEENLDNLTLNLIAANQIDWHAYKANGATASWSIKEAASVTSNGNTTTFSAFSGKAAFTQPLYVNDNHLSYLVSKQMNYTQHAGKKVCLSFKYITPTWTNNGTNTLKVMVSTTSYNSGWSEALWSSNKTDVQEWTEAEVDLSAYVGQPFYIAFVNVAGSGYCTGVDDVSIFIEGSSESRIEWSDIVSKNVNMFVKDGKWSNTDNWTAKRLPNETEKVIIDANATIASGNIIVNTLVINEGKTLTLNDGVILTVNGDFANTDVDAFIINDGAQVLQNNDDVSATFVMNINNPTNWSTSNKEGWQFIASPVKYSKISDFVPSSSDYDLYKYDGTKDLEWLNHKDETTYDAPTAPQNLAATPTSTSAMTLSWAPVEGALSYNVYYDGDNHISTFSNTYDFAGLEAGTEYCYAVTAVNAYGESSKSAEVCAKTITDAPQNLVATATGSYSIDLTWDAVEGAERYMVYKNSELVSQFVTRTDYTFENLNPATEYCFTVKSVNYYSALIGTESEASAPACATTDLAIPTAPQNVVAEATSPYSIKLTWNAVAGAATYKIYLADAVVASGIAETEYTIEGLTPQGTYYYTVTAVNVKGESPKSTAAGATTPMAMPDVPQNLVATATGSSVELTWSVSAGAASYNVYDDNGLVAEDITGTSYTVYDLEAGEHCFTVTAVNAAGETNASNSACATTTAQEQEIAENVVIGTGNSTTGALPIYSACAYSISQQIYTRAEIGQTGNIKSVSFKYKSGLTASCTRTVKVYLKHTAKELFTGTTDWVSMTDDDLVYNGDITVNAVADEWVRIKLHQPFEYKGNNLVVCVYDYTGTANDQITFAADEISEAKSLYYYSLYSASSLDPSNVNKTGYIPSPVKRNQIRFSFVTGNEPAIPAAPSNLMATCSQELNIIEAGENDIYEYSNAITLTWNADNTAESYNIYDEGGNKIGATGGNTFTIDGLETATRYCFSVSAVNETGEGATAEVCTTTITEVPQNLVARSTDATTINLSWDAVVGATSYRAYLGGQLVATDITTTSCDITGLVTGDYYCYSVAAVNEGGESFKSVLACTEAGDIQLEMCNIIFTLYDLPWGDGWRQGSKITVSYGESSVDFKTPTYDAETSAYKETYHTLSIPKGTEVTVTYTRGANEFAGYYENSFDVKCENGTVLLVTNAEELLGGETFTFVADCTPKAPTAPVLAANAISSSSIALSWNEVATATSYNVYQGGNKIATVATTSYNVEGLSANTEYCFTVKAVNEVGESEASNEECEKTLLATPTNLVATANGENTIVLTWDAVAGATSYKIYSGETAIATVTETTYTKELLIAGTEYCYAVSAVNEDGESAKTTPACATTDEAAPEELCTVVFTLGDTYGDGWTGNYLEVTDGKITHTLDFSVADFSVKEYTKEYTLNLTKGANIAVAYVVPKTGTWPSENSFIIAYPGGGEIINVSVGTFPDNTVKRYNYNFDVNCSSEDPITPETPNAPVLTAEATGSSTIVLSWNEVTGATSYNIYRNDVLFVNVTETTYTFEGLTAGTEYCFEVSSVNTVGESDATKACATTEAATVEPETQDPNVVTIGDASANNTTANANYPFANTSTYSHSQQIYTPATISAFCEQIPEGDITKIKYYIAETSQSYFSGVKVYMRNSLTSSFSSKTAWDKDFTAADLVFEGEVDVVDNAIEFVLQKSFTYDPTMNLIIYVDVDTKNGTSQTKFKTYTAAANCALYYKNQNTNGGLDTDYLWKASSGSAAKTINVVSLTFAGEGGGEEPETPVAPTAPASMTATANGQNSITLTWEAGENATSYNIYTPNNYAGSNVLGLEATTYTFEGLTAGTEYCFEVSSVNTVGESDATKACATTEAATVEPEQPETCVTVGSGTEVEAFVPVNTNYDNTISQQIYLAEDFQGKTGKIKSYAFKCAKDLSSYGTPITVTRNFKVYMINTDKSSFTSKSDWAAVTESDLVFDGSVTFQPKDEWTVVTFDTPFEYEEGKNVLICINDASVWVNGTMNYYSHVTENVRSLVFYADGNPYDATAIAVSSKFDNMNYVAQAQFTFAKSSSAPAAKMTDIKGGFEKVSAFGTSSGTELSKFETAFQQGVGYLVSYETETTATFKGTLNHEKSYTFNLDYNDGKDLANFHLLGNPFSFNMNWDNTTANGLVNGYAVVNEDGGYEYLTSGEIKVGDGFFVKAKDANPTLTYNTRGNRDREEVSSLNVVASGKAGNDNVVVNLAGEQEGFPKIQNFNEDIALIYVLDDKRPYGIYNCNSDALEVELVFKAKRMGEYNIHIEPTGEFKHVVLVDKINDVETDMLSRSYSFTTIPEENGNRFVLKFAKGEGSVEQDKFAFLSGDELIIEAEGVVQIIDVMGRVVYSSEVTSDNNRIDTSKFNTAAYIIRLINGNGVKSQKIVVY